MPNRSSRTESEVLPAITLDIAPTHDGLRLFLTQLTAFGDEHDLPDVVASRIVSVARDVAEVLTHALDARSVGRLTADADIGLDDAQLVLIAGYHHLVNVYASLRRRLEPIAARCDAFATQLTPTGEVQVWASFRLARGD